VFATSSKRKFKALTRLETPVSKLHGDILGFVDADMWVETDYVESITDKMTADDRDYMGCNVELVTDDGTIGRYRSTTGFDVEKYVREKRFAPTCCVVTRKRVFDAVGLFDSRLRSNGDLEFGRRVHEAGFDLVFEPTSRSIIPLGRRSVNLSLKVLGSAGVAERSGRITAIGSCANNPESATLSPGKSHCVPREGCPERTAHSLNFSCGICSRVSRSGRSRGLSATDRLFADGRTGSSLTVRRYSSRHSTVTLFARFRGLSIDRPNRFATQYATSCNCTFARIGVRRGPAVGTSKTWSTYRSTSAGESVTATTGASRASTSVTFPSVLVAVASPVTSAKQASDRSPSRVARVSVRRPQTLRRVCT